MYQYINYGQDNIVNNTCSLEFLQESSAMEIRKGGRVLPELCMEVVMCFGQWNFSHLREIYSNRHANLS